MTELPGRWIGYYVDLKGQLHELSDEETGDDASRVAHDRWKQLGSPLFQFMGETHISQIEHVRAEHTEGTR